MAQGGGGGDGEAGQSVGGQAGGAAAVVLSVVWCCVGSVAPPCWWVWIDRPPTHHCPPHDVTRPARRQSIHPSMDRSIDRSLHPKATHAHARPQADGQSKTKPHAPDEGLLDEEVGARGLAPLEQPLDGLVAVGRGSGRRHGGGRVAGGGGSGRQERVGPVWGCGGVDELGGDELVDAWG